MLSYPNSFLQTDPNNKHEMLAASKVYAPVPSLNLLRFLRCQAEGLWSCSSSAKKRAPCRSSERFRTFFRRNGPYSLPYSVERFGESHGCPTVLKSSLLNFEFLRRPQSYIKLHPRSSPAAVASSTSRNGSDPYARHASTDEPHLLRRIWEKRRRAQATPKSEELPLLPSFLDDNGGGLLGRSKAGKAANELRLRCTEINEHGDVTLVNGEFKKSELIAKVRKKQQIMHHRRVADTFCSMDFSRAISERSTHRFSLISSYGHQRFSSISYT